jgi:hypothetical protein
MRTGSSSNMTSYVGVNLKKSTLSKHICVMTNGLLKIPLLCRYVLNVAVSGRAVQSFERASVKNSKPACDETNLMHYLSSIYSATIPLLYINIYYRQNTTIKLSNDYH